MKVQGGRPCRRIASALAIAWVAVCATPADTPAQEAGDVDAGQRRVRDLVSAMEMGAPLRVRWDSTNLKTGDLLPPSGDLLRLEVDDLPVDVPFASVDSLWVRRNRTGRGAVLGGFIGAGLGALATWGINEAICDSPTGDCEAPPTTTWALTTGGGLVVGGLLGAAIGAGTVRWEVVFP